MVKFDETNDVKFVKVRQNETVTRSLAYVGVVYSELARKDYKELFGEDLPAEPKEEKPSAPSIIADSKKIAPVQQPKKDPPKKESKVTPAPIPKVKPEEAEIIPTVEAQKYYSKKPSETIRQDIAERIERLYQNIDEIKKDYSAITLEQRLKMILDKVEKLIDEESEEKE